MVLNQIVSQTLTRLPSQSGIVPRVLKSKKFTPAADGSWPSVTEVLDYMGYRAHEFSSDQDVKQSMQLTQQILDNFKEMNRLWTYQEPSLELMGLKQPLPTVSPFERLARRCFNLKERVHLLTEPIFVHTTDLKSAEKLLESEGEFADQYLSTSLFDPNKPSKVFPMMMGLILDVPQESVIIAYRSAFGCPPNGDHSLVAASYQTRAVKNYIYSVLMNSQIPSCDLDLKKRKKHRSISNLGSDALKHLISHYEKKDVQTREFQALFRREGSGVVDELKQIHDVAEKHLDHMLKSYDFRYLGGWHRAGEFQDRETLTSRIDDSYGDADYNEVVVHTPSRCREFGFKPPKIIGLFKVYNFSSINSTVSSLAKKHRLPIFYHPSVQHDH